MDWWRVLWKRFGGGTVLDPRELKDEGLHLIWPWNELFMYDLRLQSITETYNAISSDGVSLTASVNARFRLQRDGVAILHKAIGPNFLQLIAQPGIGSLTREVIAHYTAEQVYSTARQEIQDKIRQRTLEKASEKRMGPVALSDLFILPFQSIAAAAGRPVACSSTVFPDRERPRPALPAASPSSRHV